MICLFIFFIVFFKCWHGLYFPFFFFFLERFLETISDQIVEWSTMVNMLSACYSCVLVTIFLHGAFCTSWVRFWIVGFLLYQILQTRIEVHSRSCCLVTRQELVMRHWSRCHITIVIPLQRSEDILNVVMSTNPTTETWNGLLKSESIPTFFTGDFTLLYNISGNWACFSIKLTYF